MDTSGTIKGQLTVRGVVVGTLGCAVITASSVYVALRLGALPWPIVFAAILSFFVLKAISRGRSTLNEANVTHTVMSSGAMVAGGLAFTIPGAWMSGLAGDISLVQLAVIAICGSALGLVGSIALRRHFIEEARLEYPIGEAAAQTLKAGDSGGRTGTKLFGAMGLAGAYTFLRDGLGLLPAMFLQLPVPGVAFGIYNSPMMLAVGFLVGKWAVIAWFAGAVFASFGLIVGASAAGLWSVEFGQAVVSSLGMGCMMGCGIAVIVRDVIPRWIPSTVGRRKGRAAHGSANAGDACDFDEGLVDSGSDAYMSHDDCIDQSESAEASIAPSGKSEPDAVGRKAKSASVVAGIFVMAACAVIVCIVLQLPIWVSVITVACAFVACAMSAQSVGQTGIDPMEIFGLIALLLIALVAQVDEVRLFFVAALVAVACGLAGDVMNDFKAGHVLGTDPKAQWIGQAIGALVGSVVAVLVMQVLLAAYGPDAFGVGKEFVAAQASVVATLVNGIPVPAAFWIGLVGGFVLYLLRLPSMMFGLGIYLPFYMSFSAFLGVVVKMIYDAVCVRRRRGLSEDEKTRKAEKEQESGIVVASGILGGESIIGIALALAASVALFAI